MLAFITQHLNDFIYLALLTVSIFIGPCYKQIQTIDSKKWAGSILGLILITTACGNAASHPILSGLMGISIIKHYSIERCHVITFFFMFGYLFVFRAGELYGLPPVSGPTNLIEMIIVMRVVGVAFEMNGSWLAVTKKKNESGATSNETKHAGSESAKTDPERDPDFVELVNPEFIDLFHYTFNYIGLLTGPYYRYRTFNDFFYLPFAKSADCAAATQERIYKAPIFIALYLLLSINWPLEYVFSDEYQNSHFLYKILYPWILFAAFRNRIYAGMTLADCVCIAAGVGAYPVQGRNKSGHGPTVGYLKLKRMSEREADKADYDFKTVKSMDVWGCETVITLRDSMKVWNMAVQYWVAMVVYKRFPYKYFKTHATLFVSVIWHGYHAGYFFCIYFCPFYLIAEDIYYKLFYKNAIGMKKTIIGFIMWFLRSHSESYQAAAFLLLTFNRIWTYYSSLHHYWYTVWFAFLVVGVILKKYHAMKGRLIQQNKINPGRATKNPVNVST